MATNKYEEAYLNVDTNDCNENDCRLLQIACIKAELWDLLKVGDTFTTKWNKLQLELEELEEDEKNINNCRYAK